MESPQERERERVNSSIWKIADDLRGTVDGWDFKQYVLGALFYRFLSESLEDRINSNERAAGNEGFRYRDLEDSQVGTEIREGLIEENGFCILPSQLFCNVAEDAKKNCRDLNIKLERVFRQIIDSTVGRPSEKAFKGLFDDFDVSSNKLGSTLEKKCETLRTLLLGIESFQVSDVPGSSRDTFGDAYEFLITMYASKAGKSGGEFFTPPEVGKLLAKIALQDPARESGYKERVGSVYDPTCGSGGLLLKFAKILGAENVDGFYGQDVNLTVYNLSRMNMILHEIPFKKFDIYCEDTLLKPAFLPSSQDSVDDRFECIVSNPPYSISWKGDADPTLINDPRFSRAGKLAPKGKADWSFAEHALYYLKDKGCAAIVCFPGIFYRAGAEGQIRKWMTENNYVDSVISLPENLFFGTSISTCILVLRKNKKDSKVLFVDASDEFKHEGNKNKLTDENIGHILALLQERETKSEKSYLASMKEIETQNWSLAVNLYVQKENGKEEVDIRALNREISQTVEREEKTRAELDELIKGLGF
ncbi:MAG: type I restriction-modification system subunit M [Aeriscardovia sp.]|nr:type I restriction-modification system subunit M [Aeriscardovia sp.]